MSQSQRSWGMELKEETGPLPLFSCIFWPSLCSCGMWQLGQHSSLGNCWHPQETQMLHKHSLPFLWRRLYILYMYIYYTYFRITSFLSWETTDCQANIAEMGSMVLSLWEWPTERIILALSAWKKNFWLIHLLAAFIFCPCLIQQLKIPTVVGKIEDVAKALSPAPNHVYFVFWLLQEVSTGVWLFWYPFWPNKISVINLLKNPLGEYPLHLLWDHWAHSQSCSQCDGPQQDHRILPTLKYIDAEAIKPYNNIQPLYKA